VSTSSFGEVRGALGYPKPDRQTVMSMYVGPKGLFLPSGVVMHPNFTAALARDHQAELLRQLEFRNSQAGRGRSLEIESRRPIEQIRFSLGSALILAGTRLAPRNHVPG
jgi:hypothetical protein